MTRAQPAIRVAMALGILSAAGLLAAFLALTGISALEGSAPRLLVRTAAWLDVYAILSLLFLAGHGQPDPKGSFYFLPADADDARVRDIEARDDAQERGLAAAAGAE